jgi:DNA-binding Lrp family transcriptional regulator
MQRNARITNAELAEAVNLSPSACLRRVRRLEEEGVIEGYTTVLNQSAIGKSFNVFVEISLDSQSEESLDSFEKAVAACPNVMACYLMSGEWDYLLHVVVADPSDYEHTHKAYLSRLPHLARIRSNFALRTVAKNMVLDLR